jgi:hypothetical protein
MTETLEIYLNRYDRSLTPKEVVESFYDNPGHLLVADEADVVSAWDSLIGVGPNPRGGWCLVNQSGDVFTFTGPGQIAKNRMDGLFEPIPVRDADGDDEGVGGRTTDESSGDASDDAEPDETHRTERIYREYRIRVPSTSLGSRDRQSKVWGLLSDLVD